MEHDLAGHIVDQPGGRVYLEQLNVDAAQRVGLMVDGVELVD